MRTIGLLPALALWASWLTTNGSPLLQGLPPRIAIQSPLPGQAVQGVVLVQGTSEAEGFLSAELAFAYANDSGTWFPIARLDQPVREESLGEWDTTTLTDGDYTLRLVVNRQEGDQIQVSVAGVRVRNYSPIETSTPAPTGTPLPTAEAVLQRSPTPIPSTATPLPPNPAELTPERVGRSLLRGGSLALGVIALLGLYMRLRSAVRR